MKQLLENINSAVNDADGVLLDKEAEQLKNKYRELLERAPTECPPPDKPEKAKRGRVKKEQSQKRTSTATRKFVRKTNGFIDNVELTVTIDNKVTNLF